MEERELSGISVLYCHDRSPVRHPVIQPSSAHLSRPAPLLHAAAVTELWILDHRGGRSCRFFSFQDTTVFYRIEPSAQGFRTAVPPLPPLPSPAQSTITHRRTETQNPASGFAPQEPAALLKPAGAAAVGCEQNATILL